jgi:hypothetical protein
MHRHFALCESGPFLFWSKYFIHQLKFDFANKSSTDFCILWNVTCPEQIDIISIESMPVKDRSNCRKKLMGPSSDKAPQLTKLLRMNKLTPS